MLRKMKKAVALLAAAAMMTSIFATTVWAEAGDTATVPEGAVEPVGVNGELFTDKNQVIDFSDKKSVDFENSSVDGTYTSYKMTKNSKGEDYPITYLRGGIGGKAADDLSAYMEYNNVPKTGFNTSTNYNQFAVPVYMRKIGKDQTSTEPVTTKFKIFVKDIPRVAIWMCGRYRNTLGKEGPDGQNDFVITDTLYKNNAWNDIAITLRIENNKPVYDYYINNLYCKSTYPNVDLTTQQYWSNRIRVKVSFPDVSSNTNASENRSGMVAIDDCSGADGSFDSLIDNNRSAGIYLFTKGSSYGFDDGLKSASIANAAEYVSNYGGHALASGKDMRAPLLGGVGGKTADDLSSVIRYIDVPLTNNGNTYTVPGNTYFLCNSIEIDSNSSRTLQFSFYVDGDIETKVLYRTRTNSISGTVYQSYHDKALVWDGTKATSVGQDVTEKFIKNAWNTFAMTLPSDGSVVKYYLNNEYVGQESNVTHSATNKPNVSADESNFYGWSWIQFQTKCKGSAEGMNGLVAIDDLVEYAGEFKPNYGSAEIKTYVNGTEDAALAAGTVKAVANYHGSQSVLLPYSDTTTIVLAFYKDDVLDHVKYTQAGKLFSNGSIEVEDTITDAAGMTAKAFFIDDFDNMYPFAEAVDFN